MSKTISEKAIKDFGISYLGFSIAEGLTHPLFVIRNNYLDNTSLGVVNNTKRLYEQGGVRNFYKSAPRIFLRQGLSISAKYSMYTVAQEYYDSSNFFYNILNGLIVCNITAIFEHPIDVLAFNKSIGAKTNIKSIYDGFLANIPKQSVGAGVLPLYQASYKYLTPYLDNGTNIFVSSIGVSTLLTAMNYPFDFFRMHKIRTGRYDLRNNFTNAYSGSSLSFFRNGVHLFVFMYVIDWFKKK